MARPKMGAERAAAVEMAELAEKGDGGAQGGVEGRRLKALFAEFDLDGSGELDREEIAALTEKMGTRFNDEELDEAMQAGRGYAGGVAETVYCARWRRRSWAVRSAPPLSSSAPCWGSDSTPWPFGSRRGNDVATPTAGECNSCRRANGRFCSLLSHAVAAQVQQTARRWRAQRCRTQAGSPQRGWLCWCVTGPPAASRTAHLEVTFRCIRLGNCRVCSQTGPGEQVGCGSIRACGVWQGAERQ